MAAHFRIGVALVLAVVLFGAIPPSFAASLEEVSLPDQASVGEKSVILNGLGLRTATMLKVKVYVIGLYLENQSKNSEDIIASSQTKRIQMEFVRDVSADDIRGGWSEGFKDNYPDHAAIQQDIDSFNSGMRDMKKGDSLILDFVGDKVDVAVNGSTTASLEGKSFQQALLSIWLGKNPPNRDLKKGLLGG